jgi:hypothetical protein
MTCPSPPPAYIVYVDNNSKTFWVTSMTEWSGNHVVNLGGFVRAGEESPIIVYRIPKAVITIRLSNGQEVTYSLDDARYCGSRGCTYSIP